MKEEFEQNLRNEQIQKQKEEAMKEQAESQEHEKEIAAEEAF